MKIDIEHAGLCLLHPFIPTYFDVLQLTERNNFKSDESKARAIRLLDYMASGDPNYRSAVPSLSHYLCGEDLFLEGKNKTTLTPEEQAESEAVLNSVIEHWKALNQSGIDSLRALFLKRTGILSIRNQSMELSMNVSVMDLLLNSLPWNKTLIHLPWLKEPISVVWQQP
jgi:hypothetical protein